MSYYAISLDYESHTFDQKLAQAREDNESKNSTGYSINAANGAQETGSNDDSYSAYSTVTASEQKENLLKSATVNGYSSLANELGRAAEEELTSFPKTLPISISSRSNSISPQDLRSVLSKDYQWQSRFESILSLSSLSTQDKLAKAQRLRELTAEFCGIAKIIGAVIIEDSTLPTARRRIPSLESGKGIAGGEKYVAAQMFIKLTKDISGIYGGDSGASKAAKHEIKSLQALIECDVDGLFFPLMTLVDYLGLRLVCTSLLDGIGDSSLVYGSQDAGKTIYCSNAAMNRKVQLACEKLNLKAHNIIGKDGKSQLLYGACDLEGHVLLQNGLEKHYLLDFARLLPPESFVEAPRGKLTQLFFISPAIHQPIQSVSTEKNALEYCSEHLAEQLWLDLREESHNPAPILVNAKNRAHYLSLEAVEEQKVEQNQKNNAVLRRMHEAALQKCNSDATLPIPVEPNYPEVQPRHDFQNLPCNLKWLSRSEGLVCYNSSSCSDYNPRASAIAGRIINGYAAVIQNRGAVFFRLCRPELLKFNPLPISSDCFTGFGCCAQCRATPCPHSAQQNHAELNNLSANLFGHQGVIAQLAKKLGAREIAPMDSEALVKEMHKLGINVRWLGLLRSKLGENSLYIKELLLVEMITRTIRHILTSLLRSANNASFPVPSGKETQQTTGASEQKQPILQREGALKLSYSNISNYRTQYESGILYPVPNEESFEENSGYPMITDDEKIENISSEASNSSPSSDSGSLSHASVAITLFNLIFGNSSNSNRFWLGARDLQRQSDQPEDSAASAQPLSNDAVEAVILSGEGGELRAALCTKFYDALEPLEKKKTCDLRVSLLKFPLLMRLCEITGIKIKKQKLEALFHDSDLFERPQPFLLSDFEGFNVKTKSIDQDEAINQYIYDMAIQENSDGREEPSQTNAAANSPQLDINSIQSIHSTQSNSGNHDGENSSERNAAVDREAAIRLTYHARASQIFGSAHPLVISSSFKLALDAAAHGSSAAKAQEICLAALQCCAHTFGRYSFNFIIGLITTGEILMKLNDFKQAAQYFDQALTATGKIIRNHPLIGKLCAYLGRLNLTLHNTLLGCNYLSRSHAVYQGFYGKGIADYLAPLITMGKGTEMASAIGQLALHMKPLVVQLYHEKKLTEELMENSAEQIKAQEQSEQQLLYSGVTVNLEAVNPGAILAQYNRLRSTIGLMEEMSGLTRGYYLGKSLDLELDQIQFEKGQKLATMGTDMAEFYSAKQKRIEAELGMKKLTPLEVEFFGLNLTSAESGVLNSFFIRSSKMPVVQLEAPAGNLLRALVTQVEAKLFQAFFLPTQAGLHKVNIQYYPLNNTKGDMVHIQQDCAVTFGSICYERFVVRGNYEGAVIDTPINLELNYFDFSGNLIHGAALQQPLLSICSYNTSARTMEYFSMEKFDKISGTQSFALTPKRDGKYQLQFTTTHSSTLFWRTIPITVTAPQGKGICGRTVTMNFSAAALCDACARQYQSKCLFCSRSTYSSHGAVARICQLCTSRMTNRCSQCSHQLGFSRHTASLCIQCANTWNAKLCAAKNK
jgi:hypothetical protein